MTYAIDPIDSRPFFADEQGELVTGYDEGERLELRGSGPFVFDVDGVGPLSPQAFPAVVVVFRPGLMVGSVDAGRQVAVTVSRVLP